MEKETLFDILRAVKKYKWEPHQAYVNAFAERGCEIALVCENTVITYLTFFRDAKGRGCVWSFYDYQIAYLSEADFQKITGFFEAAPEWPEKYYERYGYRHYSEYRK